MLDLAIIGLSPQHPRSFSQLINEENPNGEGLNGVARISMVWDRDRAAAEEFAADQGWRRCSTIRLRRSAKPTACWCSKTPAIRIWSWRGPIWRPVYRRLWISPSRLSVEHAQEMIALAQTHNTPLMSSSALRFAREVLEFKAQEKELVGDLRVAVATGPNELVYYGIHAAELFYTVMGPGIAWVRNEYTDEYDIVHVRYTDGRAVTMQIIRSARYGFLLNVYGTEGKAEIAVRDANFFYAEQMRAVVRMIQTRENPIPHAEMLEIIGMLVAARQSGETGERVELFQPCSSVLATLY